MINLNTITKEELAEELICNDELTGFYIAREEKILAMDFDLDKMVEELEEWLIKNCD
jgi:hypothetical protein